MEEIIRFLNEQSIIVCAIIVVVALIIQELVSEKKGAKYELSPEEAAIMIFKGAKLYDIREKDEYKKSHIEYANWQNSKQIEMYPEKTLKPKKNYIFYCNNGNKSGELANLLRKKSGFNTYFIERGLEAWQEEGLNIYKGQGNEK